MGIHKPPYHLSHDDKKLLFLLAQLILEEHECDNLSQEYVPLSNEESEELLHFLNLYMASRSFFEAREYIKLVSNIDKSNDSIIRKFHSKIMRQRKPNIVITHHRWYELKARMGFKENHHFFGSEIKPMEVSYFLKMEERLFNECGLDPRVIDILMSLAKQSVVKLKVVDEIIENPTDMKQPFLSSVKEIEDGNFISRINLSRLAFLVTNVSVLFTTRDWEATGISSVIMGSSLELFDKK